MQVYPHVLNELNMIFQQNRSIERIKPLKSLKKHVKKEKSPFIDQLLDGLLAYHNVVKIRSRQNKLYNIGYDDEIKNRQSIITRSIESKYLLNEASKKLSKLTLNPEISNSYYHQFIDPFIYFATIQEYKQKSVIYLHDLNYEEALNTISDGIEVSHNRGTQSALPDFFFFKGLEMESKAYHILAETSWYEIDTAVFGHAIKHLDTSVEFYRKSSDEKQFFKTITVIPLALSYLLKFISNPIFENMQNLISFIDLKERYPIIDRSFIVTDDETSSKRKIKKDKILQYTLSVVYKIAALNIFEKFRYIVTDLETYITSSQIMASKIKKIDSINPGIYHHGRPASIENIVNHIIIIYEQEGKTFPPSIGILKNIYHKFKHGYDTSFILYESKIGAFAEEILKEVQLNYENLSSLDADIYRLKNDFS
jgi:hypothetical protein